MRIVISGAGGVGSGIGGRLHQHRERHGNDVVMVARPAHAAAVRAHGLRLNTPLGNDVIDVPVVEQIADAPLDDGDVVVLTMKTQDTRSRSTSSSNTARPTSASCAPRTAWRTSAWCCAGSNAPLGCA